MEKYLEKWIQIIEGMKTDNTYKPAWGKAIIECVLLEEYEVIGDLAIIDESNIAKKMMKYYWNQTFFFDLSQGPRPVLETLIRDIIKDYLAVAKSTHPIWFDKAEKILKKDEKTYKKRVKRFVTIANQNVSKRFMNVGNNKIDIYELDLKDKQLRISTDNIQVIKDFGIILIKLLNYKWAQLLEGFNKYPNITKKVIGSSNNKIKRKSLIKYKKILLEHYHLDGIKDFYTGEIIPLNQVSIDHVIPWSFLYSDDLWNLVVTTKSNNSSKGNRPPLKEEIERLKKRNEMLLETLKNLTCELN